MTNAIGVLEVGNNIWLCVALTEFGSCVQLFSYNGNLRIIQALLAPHTQKFNPR